MALARPTEPYPDQSWSGWGDPALVPELPEQVRALLTAGLGVKRAPGPPGPIGDLEVPACRLSSEAVDAMREVVGEAGILADDEARIRHTRGKSTPDLLRLRFGDVRDAPDLVVLPGSHDETLELLRLCSERRIAVVPFGGGPSGVGGLEPEAAGLEGVRGLALR